MLILFEKPNITLGHRWNEFYGVNFKPLALFYSNLISSSSLVM